MNEINSLLPRLVLVPSRVVEQVVQSRLPMSALVQSDTLSSICNNDDLLFYNFINRNQSRYLPKQLVDVFSKSEKNKPLELSLDDKLAQSTIKKVAPEREDQLRLIAKCEINANFLQSVEISSNNYVGHFFEIDRDTIGCMLVVSLQPKADELTSLRSLMLLLANNYMGTVDGVATVGNDVHLQRIVNTNLLSHYGRNFTDKEK